MLEIRNILETLNKNYPKFVPIYVQSVQIYSVTKFMAVLVQELSILGLVMQEFLKDYENLQNCNFLKTLLIRISQ